MKKLPVVPTVEQTRKAIEDMEIKNSYDTKFQQALKYLFLIAGRLAEVYGTHSPLGRDTLIREIYGENAIIFLVKTARRKGLYRVIAVPEKKEPWALELFEFFRSKENLNNNPFDIGHSMDTSRKYIQKRASELFDSHGHEMSREPYPRMEKRDASGNVIKTEQRDGKEMYLIEYPDGERHWHEEKIMKFSYTEQEQPKKFRTKHLREQREDELRNKYLFSDEQARTYLGLKQNTRVTNLIRYDGIEPIEDKILQEIEDIAKTYYKQFL